MVKKITKGQMSVLERERDQTLKELERLREVLKAEVEMDDIDDVASDLVERDKTHALILGLERKLEDIEHALRQAQEVGYGICERCGNPIEPERLEIFPETTLCINCKRETERMNRRRALDRL